MKDSIKSQSRLLSPLKGRIDVNVDAVRAMDLLKAAFPFQESSVSH